MTGCSGHQNEKPVNRVPQVFQLYMGVSEIRSSTDSAPLIFVLVGTWKGDSGRGAAGGIRGAGIQQPPGST